MMWKSFLIILSLLAFPVPAMASGQPAGIEQLDTISDDAFQMVKNQRYEDAQKLLSYFTEQFNGLNNSNLPFTLDEMRIVSDSRDEAMEAAASPTMNYQERLNRITKFRLVIDALATSHEPLWAEMEDQVMGAYNLSKKAAIEGNPSAYKSNVTSFLSLYNLIYPSVKIDMAAERIQRLDAGIDYFKNLNAAAPASAADIEELESLGTGLQDMFDGIEEDEADPSLWWVIISTGSIIILTLSYVGWRKFQGDRELARKRSHKLKD